MCVCACTYERAPAECVQLFYPCLPQLDADLGHLYMHDPRQGDYSRGPLLTPIVEVVDAVVIATIHRLDDGGCHLEAIRTHETSALVDRERISEESRHNYYECYSVGKYCDCSLESLFKMLQPIQQ